MKPKVELTVGAVRKVIDERKPDSMTKLAHGLGYKGSVSSSLTRRLRALLPDVDVLLKRAAESAKGGDGATAPATPRGQGKAKPAASKEGKWPHDERSRYRPGSSYDVCYSILSAHPQGLPRAKLIELLAVATGKDEKHAGYDAQVVLSAWGNEPGLSRNDGPRHRSARPGYWVKRANGHVSLVVD